MQTQGKMYSETKATAKNRNILIVGQEEIKNTVLKFETKQLYRDDVAISTPHVCFQPNSTPYQQQSRGLSALLMQIRNRTSLDNRVNTKHTKAVGEQNKTISMEHTDLQTKIMFSPASFHATDNCSPAFHFQPLFSRGISSALSDETKRNGMEWNVFE